MIIYIEKEISDLEITKIIIGKFKNANIIFIDNYKNIFSKTLPKNSNKWSFVLAKIKTDSILEAPKNYGHNNINSYFLKTSLNCVFNCSYCYLKWAFKNDIPIYFLNYDEIKSQIEKKINSISNLNNKWKNEYLDNDYELRLKTYKGYKNKIWFYSWDYSDIIWANSITRFLENFVEFFEKFDNSMMEVRTKSSNIKDILDLWFVPKNTEFAFSLNPQNLIESYEFWTSSLKDRIKAINKLLGLWYKVWLRFLPLLPVKNYKKIYSEFVALIKENIDMNKITSCFASGLLYTKKDYKVMLKKYPKLDLLYKLQKEKDGFFREEKEVRDFFYKLFKSLDEKCFICLDEF